eukprot:CAMPEP_0201919708 /NCGR_PEP_ID=MMETSP0903-20130614/8518_1 /ASSEMBLY_ACC=CAM_ASM_000552 /TAXON_ID=420261 /ORGANISM="Thalassiosira antarctica, Strain CCMP982" /LENGTH=120 /DNA_ID=CAMNT_0048456295 /DNA_START=247 /DNA_END=609 /DNA_ORIENTATION=+
MFSKCPRPNESQTSSISNNGKSNVYSFFDPADIRKPPTSPSSINQSNSVRTSTSATTNNNNNMRQPQPFDESPGVGGDDAASRCSGGSAATDNVFAITKWMHHRVYRLGEMVVLQLQLLL